MNLPELPPIDPKMQIGYEAIRYVAGYTESYLKDYARAYAEEAVRTEREACATAAYVEARMCTDAGKCHPEDSASRDRCMARARTAVAIAEAIRDRSRTAVPAKE